jgi:acyloxyacyl hydrolase
LLKLFESHQSPDVICEELQFCAKFKQCKLFPQRNSDSAWNFRSLREPWWEKLIHELFGPFIRVFSDHKPLVDVDGDGHSVISHFRGSIWRGKDCNDGNKKIYPGRDNTIDDASIDHNCNGIFGTDPVTKKSYEELFCSDTPNRGVRC